MANTCMLSTIDNPYNPFEDFDQWFMYDVDHGYNSCERVDRYAQTSNSLTDEENMEELERAIDEIIKDDILDRYIKVIK